jgi:hypothetical protein
MVTAACRSTSLRAPAAPRRLAAKVAPAAPAVVAPPPAARAPARELDPRVRRHTDWSGPLDTTPEERARQAVEARLPIVKQLFAAAQVEFPPGQMLLRAFKKERELEVWASTGQLGPLVLVATYEICGLSGVLGPKRREGDRQVPEGFYKIQYLWPNSSYFHLEMKIGYPNDLDRHLGDQTPEGPGGDIMIHGTCGSAGCLAVGDERVEELWTMASAFHGGDRRIHVHIFPARDIAALLRDLAYARHHPFWANLLEGFDRFERDHCLFRVTADWHLRYLYD